jgi:Uma2 family endonuclease
MSLHEIVLPETKPETEWVRGRALRKVSPTYPHGCLQRLLATALGQWADEAELGRVAAEWRFRITPPGGITRPLVPDVAYLSYADLPADAPPEDVSTPRMAPTLATEILSPDDRPADVEDKIIIYLSGGCTAVLVVDPETETGTTHDADGPPRTTATTFTHRALPGLEIDLRPMFARCRR